MITLHLEGVSLDVVPLAGGQKLLRFEDPQSAITVVCGLTEEGAKDVGAKLLAAGVTVARTMPPGLGGSRNGESAG